MDRWLSVADIAERYNCCPATARTRMRQMIHMEKPLMVRESVVAAWETARLVIPGDDKPIKRRRSGWEQPERDEDGKPRIPMRRARQ